MKNIIKAQFYQLRHDKLIKILFLVLLFLQITNMFGELDYSAEAAITAGSYFVNHGSYFVFMAALFGMIWTSQVCGEDFIDKTANYELMAGHKRSEVYFGRVILSVIGGLLGGIVLFTIPVAIVSMMFGFGNDVMPKAVICRLILSVFPMLRMICEVVFIVYVIKNPYIAMFCSVLISLFGQNISMFLEKANSVFLGITNLNGILTFETYSTYSALTLEKYYIYNGSLDMGYMMETIISSIVIGGIFLLLGYVFFKKDDLS